MVLGLLLSFKAYAGISTAYKLGKGSLKITKDTADVIEYFFSGGKKGYYAEKQKEAWKPGLMAISVDGAYYSFLRHPLRVTNIDGKHYAGMVIKDCKKKSGQECFLFANAYKIVWDNGSDRKKRRLKRKDIKTGKTIALLTELGFYDRARVYSSSTTPKITKKKKDKRSIVLSWDGYEDLILGTVGEESDEGQTIVELKLPNGDSCEGIYLIQSGGRGTWQVACTNNNGAAGTLKWSKDGGVTGSGIDHNNKKVKFTVSKYS